MGWVKTGIDGVSEEDRRHWDRRYAEQGVASVAEHHPPAPPVFETVEHLFPADGQALEIACGRGRGAVWLAARGMQVWAVDVSPVAIGFARQLAFRWGVADRCRFSVVDLDDGLPDGPPVNLVFVHLFRDSRLDQAIIDRLAPGGLLAIAVQSEVDAGPGPFRARPGELREAFGSLEIITDGEADGMAWLVARRPTTETAGSGHQR